MFQWKNIQLSTQDYQNYVNNEDQSQMKINNSNITQLQWANLYQKIQQKSLHNKNIKKFILSYENNLKKLLGCTKDSTTAKQLLSMYGKHSNQLKMQLSQLYGQLGLLHIKNLSTSIQFTISRLLSLQEELIKIIFTKQNIIQELKQNNNALELAKNTLLCISCYQEIQKNRNKFMIKQIMAVRQSSYELEQIQVKELAQPLSLQKKLKDQQKHQQHQYEIQRFYYLNSVEEVLRNREKTLKCNSAPLQNLLSQYLTQILEMLQGNKFAFTQKNIKEYDRINKSYQSLDDMKSLINNQQFYKSVSILIEKPYQNLVENIEKFINKSQNKNKSKTTVQTQTVYLTQFNQIKILQKNIKQLSNELQGLRQSKHKNENDLLNNIQSLHRTQIKYMQIVHRNKNLQSDYKRQENLINELKNQIASLELNHKSQLSKLIETNLTQKSMLIRQIKILQGKIHKHQLTLQILKDDKEIQTDVIDERQSMSKPYTDRTSYKKNIEKRFQRKQNKKVSLKLQQIKMIKSSQTQLRRLSPQKVQLGEQIIMKSRQNSLLDINRIKRSQFNKKSLKMFTINPLNSANNGEYIHRVSSKIKENQSAFKSEAHSILRIQTPLKGRKGIKKFTDLKLKHNYHNSQLMENSIKSEHPKPEISRLSVITGKKILRQSSAQIRNNQHTQIQSFANMHSKQQAFSKELLFKSLESENQKYLVTISQPNGHSKRNSQQQLLSVLLENEQSILQPRQKEQLSQLIKFSLKNFESLIEKNIFAMICDMKFDKQPNKGFKKQQIKETLQKNGIPQPGPTIDIECSKIGRKCIQIFFNMEQAQKYEKKIGIWGEIDSFIMIDNNFSHQCEKIQLYFNRLKQLKPMFYQQAILFLEKPYYFCQQVEGKDYETKQITIFRQSLRSFELEKDWIKKLFKKLLRLHKLMHKNCSHIHKFLQVIGFYQ